MPLPGLRRARQLQLEEKTYEPTSPAYSKMPTSEEIEAVRAASDKRRRTGDAVHFREGFFAPGYHIAKFPMNRPGAADMPTRQL